MIPKILHYIWFGGNEMPELAVKCIESWKKYMPEWEYKCWNETSLSLILSSQRGKEGCWLDYMPLYVRQAYEARKFAFVSDYVRLWALEQYGGVYVDTDVMVLRSYEPLLGDTAFIGMEESLAHFPGTCVMGCEPHCQWVKDMLEVYNGVEFIKADSSLDMTTNVQRMGNVMIKELRDEKIREFESEGVSELRKYWKYNQYIGKWGLRIYTYDYFSPITSTRVMRKTKNTYSIHYFAGSWVDGKKKHGWRDWVITREIINVLVQVKRALKGKGGTK